MRLVLFAFMVAAAGVAWPQTPLADQFLKPYGLAGFSSLYRESLGVFLRAEDSFAKKDYSAASKVLEAFWLKHPPGTDEWVANYREAWQVGRDKGVNVGCPTCYYALRMLTDCVRWRRGGVSGVGFGVSGAEPNRDRPSQVNAVTLTVVLVGHSKGIEPRSKAELQAMDKETAAGRDPQTLDPKPQTLSHDLDPLLQKDGNRIVEQSLWLFREYILAATDGRLSVRVRIVPLKDVTVPVHVSGSFAGMADGAWERIWPAVGDKVRATTDWWWVLYPSNVPEQYPDFERAEFITGGMGSGPDGASPCFIIDDRWLTRKPPHIGKGPYTDIERRTYLPQWLQHEFFHHLFRIYPEFGLEKKGHDWFDRKTWPADFEGKIEPDYYYEALHKRLQPKGNPPLHLALLYQPPPASLYRSLSAGALAGGYRHEPVENDWHIGRIEADPGGGLRWTNKAGVTWRLTPDLASGVLHTGPDCPYYKSGGTAFQIVLKRDADGRWLPKLAGYEFNGAFFGKE